MLNEVFDPSRIKLDLESTTKIDVLGELIETIALPDTEFNRQELLDAVVLRESKMSTNVMRGVAVPHGYCSAIRGVIGAIGVSRAGIKYDSFDREPVHIFFMLLMDESSQEEHLYVLNRLLEMLNSTVFSDIWRAQTPQEVYDMLCSY